ncbi:MAG: hypothetical protein LBI32_01725 [Myroides odoratus]|jgi:hypothetical protein|nr:hypothetical protein [Myroides odoratus]
MNTLFNFDIHPKGAISEAFLHIGIYTFQAATAYICGLPYGRNANKADLRSFFADGKGTCSTKHAVLKQVAEENGYTDLHLILGIFKMNGQNTPLVGDTLAQYQLDYIPEAHTYLKYKNQRFDFTRTGASPADFQSDLLVEYEIQANEIGAYKVRVHQEFMAQWLQANQDIPYATTEIWAIREQCIQDLSV